MSDRDTQMALGLVALVAFILGGRLAVVDTRKARAQTVGLVLLLPVISGILCMLIFASGSGPAAGFVGFILVWGMASLATSVIASAFAWAATWLACQLCRAFRGRR